MFFYRTDILPSDIPDNMERLVALSEKYGLSGNLWHNYLAYTIAFAENVFSCMCEKKGEPDSSVTELAMCDFSEYIKLFSEDISDKLPKAVTDYHPANARTSGIGDLAVRLSEIKEPEAFLHCVCEYYRKYGAGRFASDIAFRVDKKDGEVSLVPIESLEDVSLDDIVGYEIQKKKLIDNTEAFLAGKNANNVLLFGDSGTGKSTSIKAVLNEYKDAGLRMIEIYKHQFDCLSRVINIVKDRNYRFIIYMDDLSFEDFEIEYKYLKAIIEGGLEKRPDNVLIYATSNRRHLVREKYSDKEERDDDLHTRDTVQEKLSLSARFGVSIYYGSPDKKEYNNIVKTLADRQNIKIDEATLYLEAGKWELSHGGLSGRTASQFITYLMGVYSDNS